MRGKEDPYATVGQVNKRDQSANSEYVWALKDINFEVDQGEVLGIIGANGAGKSTLLKIISRITSPTSGYIKAKGRVASLLEVGTGMNEEMTARENVYLNGSILGMRRMEIAKKFDEIIEFAGCRMYVDTPVKRYSSGMRVRLGFAVAAFLEPTILIVDEVLAVGDAEFRQRAVTRMKQLATSGRTILFVSHHLPSIADLCTRCALVENGSLTRSGEVQDIISAYIRIAGEKNAVSEGDWIKGVRVDATANADAAIYVSDDLNVSIQITTNADLIRPRIALAIYSSTGVRVTRMAYDPDGQWNAGSYIEIRGKIAGGRLAPGEYRVKAELTNQGTIHVETIEQAAVFSVYANDSSMEKDLRSCVVYAPVTWQAANVV